MRILVIGLSPSKKGGSAITLKNLFKWLDHFNVKYVSFTNLYDGSDQTKSNEFFIKDISKTYDKVISLGTHVHDRLLDFQVDHHSLPHPSGLNRQLNNPKYVHERLEACKNYLYGR